MLKFLQKINIKNFKKAITETFKRMPLAMLISIVTFILIVVIVRVDDMSQVLEDNLHKAVFSLIVVFFFSVAIYLYSEAKNITKITKWFYQMITFVFGFLFYYFFEENLFSSFQEEVAVYFVLTILGVVAFVFIAPFIDKLRVKKLGQEEFYIATYNLLIKILMSIIVGLATMFLGFIAFSAIFALFDIEFINEGNWYAYWSAFSLALFAPIFFLANLPFVKENELGESSNIQNNKFYSFLINYVGLPAILIYFLILYAYTIKVLINFSDWPQGKVTWLVIFFSFFGYLIYFATFAFTNTFKPALMFRKVFPIAVFLQTFMLFYAIGLRINQYDITINRYLVVAFGLWLFGLSLYYIISKKKSLSAPFYSLLIVIIFISIGPWSVYVVPEWRQQNNLEINLKNANILQADNKIAPLEKYQDILAELSGEIYSGIDYLCNYHGCGTLDKYFSLEIAEIKKKDREEFEEHKKKQLEQAEKERVKDSEYIESIKKREYSPINNRRLFRQLTEKIKVKRYYKSDQDSKTLEYFNFRNNNSYMEESIDVRGYDYFVQVYSNNFNREIINGFDNSKEEYLSDMHRAVLDIDAKKLELYLGKAILETFQIEKTIIKPLLEKKDNSLEPNYDYESDILLDNQDMTFEFIGAHYDLRLVLREVSIRNPEWKAKDDENNNGDIDYFDKIEKPMLRAVRVEGYVLIREKK